MLELHVPLIFDCLIFLYEELNRLRYSLLVEELKMREV